MSQPSAVTIDRVVTNGLPDASEVDFSAAIDESWQVRSTDPARALALASATLPLARRSADRHAEALCLRNVAAAHVAGAEYALGSAIAHDACAIFAEVGDAAGESVALATIATASRRSGENAHAHELLSRALELAQRSGNSEALTICLNGFGHVHRSKGDYELSLELHRQALALAEAEEVDEEACSAALGVGASLERLGRFPEALEAYRQSLAMAERSGRTRIVAYAAGNIGTILERQGRLGESLEYELRSLAGKERTNDRWGLGISYNNLGVIYRYLGEYASSFEAFLKSLEVTREIGDREGESVALNGIGQACEELGDITRVLEYYTTSLEIAKQIGYKQGEAYSLSHLGRFHEKLGDLSRALTYHLRCLRLSEQTGDRYVERSALACIAHVYGLLGDVKRADSYLERALTLSREMGDRLGEATTLQTLGEMLAGTRRDPTGIEYLREALVIATEVGNREVMLKVHLALVTGFTVSGDEASAAEHRALYQACAEELFNAEATRRVSELLVGFEGESARRHARQLGLGEEDLPEIAEAVQRGIESRMSSIGRPEAAAVASDAAIVRDGLIDADPTGIVVRTFGEFRVSVGGRELGTAEWKRKRARDLFKLLLINHRRSMTIDEIIETLWEGKADRKSEMLVMNAISHIRSALEPERRRGAGSSYLVGSDRSYSLHLDESVWIDFLRFKEIIVSARRAESARERRGLYEQAAGLYRGDFLKEDYYEPWTASERDLLKDAFLEAVEFLAVEYQRAGEHDAAIGAARRILAHDGTSERAAEVLIAALVARGRHSEARRALEECRNAWRRELDEAPPERFATLLNAR